MWSSEWALYKTNNSVHHHVINNANNVENTFIQSMSSVFVVSASTWFTASPLHRQSITIISWIFALIITRIAHRYFCTKCLSGDVMCIVHENQFLSNDSCSIIIWLKLKLHLSIKIASTSKYRTFSQALQRLMLSIKLKQDCK